MGMGSSNGRKGMSPLNVQALDSMLALALTLPVALFLDGPGVTRTELDTPPGQIVILLVSVGLTYFLFNFGAFNLLDKLDVVSHAVCDLGKRIFVIGASIVFFGTPLTVRAVVGTCITIAGSGLYSYVKATASGKPKQPSCVQKPTVVALSTKATVQVYQVESSRFASKQSSGSLSTGIESESADEELGA